MILKSTFSLIEWCHYGIVYRMKLWILTLTIVWKVDLINLGIINLLNITRMPTSLELGIEVYVTKKVIRIGVFSIYCCSKKLHTEVDIISPTPVICTSTRSQRIITSNTILRPIHSSQCAVHSYLEYDDRSTSIVQGHCWPHQFVVMSSYWASGIRSASRVDTLLATHI